MCGRYSITTPIEAMRRLFHFQGLPNLGPNYNVAPTSAVPVVRFHDGERELAMMRWGLVPSWAKEIQPKPLINARSETISEKPSFRSSYQRRRCLVPADGYYEWRKEPDGSKQPFYIHRKDGQMFAMAGIWNDWMSPDGSELDTMAIATTAASANLSALHHRMPVILAEEDFDTWLDPNIEKDEAVDTLLNSSQGELFDAYPVSKRVNRVGVDEASVIERVELDNEGTKSSSDRGQLDLL